MKKAIEKTIITSVGVLLTVLAFLVIVSRPLPPDMYIGRIAFDIMQARYESDKALLFIDQSAKLSLPFAIRETGLTGGSFIETFEGQVQNLPCGIFLYPLWNNKSEECFPEPGTAITRYLDTYMNTYFRQYPPFSIPQNNYDYEINAAGTTLSVVGHAKTPLRIGVGKAGTASYSEASCGNFPMLTCGRRGCINQFMRIYGSTEAEVRSNLVKISFLGHDVFVHKKAKAAFECASKEALACAPNYNFGVVQTFNWRCVRGYETDTPNVCRMSLNKEPALSTHSFGIAFDINPDQNPMCYPTREQCSKSDGTPVKSDIPVCVVQAFKKNGFDWGGSWTNVVDPMHFQWQGDPDRLIGPVVTAGVQEDVARSEIDYSFLISDSEFTDTSVTEMQIQEFLEKRNSVLAQPVDGLTPSREIYLAAVDKGINPIVLLATLQKEKSLITAKNPSKNQLDWAAGCGCPDHTNCDPRHKGFGNQMKCMADTLSKHYKDGVKSAPTEMKGINYAGSCPQNRAKIGMPSVIARNAATYSLYKYTPHTVDICLDDIGGGNHLFSLVYRQYYKDIMGRDPSSVDDSSHALGYYEVMPNFKAETEYDLSAYDVLKNFVKDTLESYSLGSVDRHISNKLHLFNQQDEAERKNLTIYKYCTDYPVMENLAEQYLDCYYNEQTNCVCEIEILRQNLTVYPVEDYEIRLYRNSMILQKKGDAFYSLEPGKRTELVLPFLVDSALQGEEILESVENMVLKLKYGTLGQLNKAQVGGIKGYDNLQNLYLYKRPKKFIMSDGDISTDNELILGSSSSIADWQLCTPKKEYYTLCAEHPKMITLVKNDKVVQEPVRIRFAIHLPEVEPEPAPSSDGVDGVDGVDGAGGDGADGADDETANT